MSVPNAWTPGPWAVFRDAYGGGLYIDTALGIDSSNGMVVAGQIHGKQRDANARLIAAAPELYEALDDVLIHCLADIEAEEQKDEPDEAALTLYRARRDKAQSALAKARGESPHNQSNPKVGA